MKIMKAPSNKFLTLRRSLYLGVLFSLVMLQIFSASCSLEAADIKEVPENHDAVNDSYVEAEDAAGVGPTVIESPADDLFLTAKSGTILADWLNWLKRGEANPLTAGIEGYEVGLLAVNEFPEQTRLWVEASLHTDGQSAEKIGDFNFDIEDLGHESADLLIGIAAAPDGSSQWRWGAYHKQQINPETVRFAGPTSLQAAFEDHINVDFGATPRILMPEEGVVIDSSPSTIAVILYSDGDAPRSLEDFLQTQEDNSTSSWVDIQAYIGPMTHAPWAAG